jgi:hypothetical protein
MVIKGREIKELIDKLEKRYEDEFKYRKRNIKDDFLNIQDNEGLYDAGFINGMRSLLMQITDYKYDYITKNELEQIVKENKELNIDNENKNN